LKIITERQECVSAVGGGLLVCMFGSIALREYHGMPDLIQVIKPRRLRWAEYVARIGESKDAYRVLVGKPEGRRRE
jgi:hypothetical protein